MKLFKNNLSFLTSHLSSRKGFTLIELLIVIAILGILAAGIVVVINPMEKINSANLAKAKTFAAGVENSLVMSQVGRWSFEEGSGSTVKDTSGNGNDGAINGEVGTMWQNSAQCGLDLGGCLKFDGSGYIDMGDSSSLAPTNAFTLEAWINPEKTTPDWECSKENKKNCVIWSNHGNASWSDVISVIGDGKLWFYTRHSEWSPFESKKSILANAWSHVVFTWDGKIKRIYINGILDNQIETSGYMNGLTPTWIGRKGGSHSGYFKGLIDEVKIYNKALLSYQIQQLYAQGLVRHLLALK